MKEKTLYEIFTDQKGNRVRAGDVTLPAPHEIQTKVLKVFLLAIHTSQSSLQLCPDISISSNSLNLFLFLLYTLKEKGANLIENHTPYPTV
jgi:hypothetical protein